MFKLFKKKESVESKSDDELLVEKFIKSFRDSYAEEGWNTNGDEVREMSDDDIFDIVQIYLNKPSLTEANKYWYEVIDEYVKGSYDDINWKLGREEAEKTPEYYNWRRKSNIRSAWSCAKYDCNLEEEWVAKNGKRNTDEEAAKKAADKWCELIFGWHLQDNGAINENHGGGFMACALGTVLADESKKGISEETKKKAHELFYEYYRRKLHYEKWRDKDDIKWLVENLPDDDIKDPFDWNKFAFRIDLYCDYGPGTPLYLILVNAGVDGRDAKNICPWKTGINIRTIDNAVMYNTYQHQEEI